MSNRQLRGLYHTLMRSSSPDRAVALWGPYAVKIKALKRLRPGDRFSLGERLPELALYCDGAPVGRARLGRVGPREALQILESTSDGEAPELPGRKRVPVEFWLAPVDTKRIRPGERILFDAPVSSAILMVGEGRELALLSLGRDDAGYCLRVEELGR